MVEIPHSLVDFADALKMLAQSQSDVTELVTKWDMLMDSETPGTVQITVGGVTHEVDNLAKVRQDLVQGLSLESPTVTSITFKGTRTNGKQSAVQSSGLAYIAENSDAFDPAEGMVGQVRNLRNDLRTLARTYTSRVDVSLVNMPRVICVGIVDTTGVDPVSTVDLYISAPSVNLVDSGVMTGYKQYYATVRFVNRNFGRLESPNVSGNPVTVNLHDAMGTFTVSRTIPALGSVEYLVFAGAGQDTVNVQEIAAFNPAD